MYKIVKNKDISESDSESSSDSSTSSRVHIEKYKNLSLKI